MGEYKYEPLALLEKKSRTPGTLPCVASPSSLSTFLQYHRTIGAVCAVRPGLRLLVSHGACRVVRAVVASG
jgi:hypothetical protein